MSDDDLMMARTAGSNFFSEPEKWRFKQMAATGLSFKMYGKDGNLLDPIALGSEIEHVGKPEGWSFADVPEARHSPLHPDFVRFRTNSLCLNDDAAVRAFFACLHSERQALGLLRQSAQTDSDHERLAAEPGLELHQLEIDGPELEKCTIQKGSMGHWFITKQGGAPDPECLEDDLFLKVLRHVAAVYVRSMPPRAEWPSKAPPADTNSGFPFFGNHPALKLAASLMVGSTIEETVQHGQEISALLQISPKLNFCLGVAARSGPLAKIVDILRFTGVNWAVRGKGKGFRQRERVVMMASPTVNWLLEGLFGGMHESRRHIPGLWHAGTADRDLAAKFPLSYECDISAYDTSVSRGLQEAWIRALKEAGAPLTALEVQAYLWSETLPLATPHWALDDAMATIVRFRGATRSGLKHTAEAGTFMAVTASLYALAEQGYDYTAWPKASDFALLHQGDDALVCVTRALSRDAWRGSYAKVGFEAKLLGSDVFLSKHQRAPRVAGPRIGRLIQQTASNEKEKTGPEDLALGLQIIGFIGRCEGIQGLCQRGQTAVWRALQPIYWIRIARSNLRCKDDLSSFVHALRTEPWSIEQQKISLKWRESTGWFTKMIRDADHSPSAAAIVAHAQEMGLDSAELTALDRRVWKAVKVLNDQTWAVRREFIGEVILARGDGQTGLDQVFAKWTNRYLGVEAAKTQTGGRNLEDGGER